MACFNKIKQFEVPDTEQIFDLKFLPTNSRMLACGTVEGDVMILDSSNTNKPVSLHLNKHHKGSSVRRVAFTANENNLVSAAKSIKIFDLNHGKVLRKIKGGPSKIHSLAVIDQYLLCAGDDEGCFRVWDYRENRGCMMEIKECDDYISDLDVDSARKIVVATSGEGTLSAFNVRARRMEQPQSELFDAGFESVRFYEERNRVLVGAEDGAINIFNINEWGNISDRFPLRCSAGRGSGLCSINHMEVLSVGDDQASVVILGVGDGKIRAMSVLPNKIIAEGECHPSSVESLAACSSTKQVASSDTNCIFIHELIINQTGDDQEGPQVSAGDSASNVSTSSSSKKAASSSSMTNFFADL